MGDAASLRSVTLRAVGGAVAVFAALVLVFGALLEPGEVDGCMVGLHPGPYADALIPAHLAAFALLAALVARLAAARSAGPWTPRALAALTAFVLAAVAWHPLMDWPAIAALIAIVPVGGSLLLAGVVHTAITARTASLSPAQRWERHALAAQVLLWAALVLALPAHFAGAYLNSAGLFCF